MDEGLDFALRYPFSGSAKKAIEGITLTERIIDLGVERIRKALRGDSGARMVFHESDKKEDIASFAAARMILGYLRNPFLTTRFAVNESKTVRGHLDRGDGRTVDLIAAQFGIATRKDGERLFLDLPTYLRYSVHDPHYRLVNRRIVNGMVEINDSEKKRLIESAVKKYVEDIPIVKNPPDMMKEAGKKLINELPKTESRIVVRAGDHPPCIMKLLESIKKHENLPHHARWYLATYLLAINTAEEDIVKVYTGLPDFNEKVTKYQVAHAKKKGYSVPSCATVMTYGLCCAVCSIGNPLNWHTLSKERKDSVKR